MADASAAIAVAFIVGGCSGAPSAPSTVGAQATGVAPQTSAAGPAGTPAGPGATATPVPALPTTAPAATPSSVDVSGVCDGIGSLFSSPAPVLDADPDLVARYPASISGQPVTDVTANRFVQILCAFGASEDDIAELVAQYPPIATMTYGSGHWVPEGGYDTQIESYRFPGLDASLAVPFFGQFIVSSTQGSEGWTAAPSTIGGKQAFTITDPEGFVRWALPSGDTLFVVDSADVTEEVAAEIFAAIQ